MNKYKIVKIMKNVIVNEGSVALVFKQGALKKVLKKGSYWVGFGVEVEIHNLKLPFRSSVDVNILLLNGQFQELIIQVIVKDQELVFKYSNGIFKEVLESGQHYFWKGLNDFSFIKIDKSQLEIPVEISKSLMLRPEVIRHIRMFEVLSYENALMYIDGVFQKELSAGKYFFWNNLQTIEFKKADLRQVRMELTGQEILTLDKAAIRVNFELTYRVVDIYKALVENKDFEKQLYVIMQMALREYLGSMTLDELLEKKVDLNKIIFEITASKVVDLGIMVGESGIKDIILPGDVKEIMNQVLIAQKKAQSNVIYRREEVASTRSMLNTAKMMEENPMLFKLKEMEYVEKIAERINSISLAGGVKVLDQLKEIFT